jgi:hypothetical protein
MTIHKQQWSLRADITKDFLSQILSVVTSVTGEIKEN